MNASLSLECTKELPKEVAPSRDDFSVSMAKVEEPLSKLSNSIPKQHHAAYGHSPTRESGFAVWSPRFPSVWWALRGSGCALRIDSDGTANVMQKLNEDEWKQHLALTPNWQWPAPLVLLS